MIPKKKHFCWFGRNPKPISVEKCIKSWKKYCANYEIIEWNEENINVEMNVYTLSAYKLKKYAFLTDYLRLYIVNKYGGIYLDTDVEIIRPFDDLLNNKSFFGFENINYVNTGLGFGAEKENEIVKLMLEEYRDLLKKENSFLRCTELNTTALVRAGLLLNGQTQDLNGNVVFSPEYFCPKDYWSGITRITGNTYSIHHFDATWFSEEQQIEKKQRWKKAKIENYYDIAKHLPNLFIRKLIGDKLYEGLKKRLKK